MLVSSTTTHRERHTTSGMAFSKVTQTTQAGFLANQTLPESQPGVSVGVSPGDIFSKIP